jgi:hypothetical protein
MNNFLLFPFLKERVIGVLSEEGGGELYFLSVCPNQSETSFFYFSSFRCSDKTLLYVIGTQDSKSEVGFLISINIQ